MRLRTLLAGHALKFWGSIGHEAAANSGISDDGAPSVQRGHTSPAGSGGERRRLVPKSRPQLRELCVEHKSDGCEDKLIHLDPGSVTALLVMLAVVLMLAAYRSPGPSAAVLGFLMPMTAVPGVPYAVIVGARIALSLLLAARWRADIEPYSLIRIRGFLVPISALAALTGGFAVMRGDTVAGSTAAGMLESVIVAFLVVSRRSSYAGLAAGFIIGTSTNAVVALTYANSHVNGGGSLVARYIGFSASSTRVSYEYAVAILLIALAPRTSSGATFAIARLACAGLLLAGLAISGGRGGLLALAFALVLVSQSANRAARRARSLSVVLLLLAVGAVRAGVHVSLVDRLVGPSADQNDHLIGGITSGRSELAGQAFDAISSHPLSGTGLGPFLAQYGYTPHTSPEYFGVATGFVGFAIALAMALRIWFIAVRPRPAATRGMSIGIAILSVLAIRTVLEPTAPFVGMEDVTLLLVACRLVFDDSPRTNPDTPKLLEPTQRMAPSDRDLVVN